MKVIYGNTDCRPEETGFDSGRLEVLDRRLGEMVEKQLIHGAAYCISHKGKVIACRALGRGSGLGGESLMQPDTVFGIASITKVFTAAAVMQLIEDGLTRLDCPAGDILPQFRKKPFDRITLLQLLTHSSGIYPDKGCFDEEVPSQWELIGEAAKEWDGKGEFDWITPALSVGLRREPGTEWQYSSFCFTLLGEVISRLSGMSAQEYIEAKITRPLGMKDTGFTLSRELSGRLFIHDEEEQEYVDSLLSGEGQAQGFWAKIPDTAGGLYSTVCDLVRFGNAFIGGGRLDGARILGRKSVEKMSRVQLSGVPDRCWGAREDNRLYGIGFDIRRTPAFSYSDNTIMHEGAGASSLDIDLDEQLCAAWFVPFDKPENGWSAEPLYNVQNIIWSGII
ncbi:MAG: beta-lactamase family protein [Ruminococcus sp.]|nr:beta-lactamase family protein [Ruminococcus sp.]